MIQDVTLKDILTIIHRTINSVDKRLLNHGEQVAYIMLSLLKADGGYREEEIVRICTIAMFHDIGAYKVTERDRLVEIDSVKPFHHAVYGSLFIKHFSPLSDLSNIILGHHFTAKYIERKNIKDNPKEALMLSLADHIAIVYLNKKLMGVDCLKKKEKYYLKENIDLFIEADQRFNVVNNLNNNTYAEELYKYFDGRKVSREEVIGYVKMLTYAIDFRSEATVKHTILVEAISHELAILCGLNAQRVARITIAATLHDIGKITIPIEILEKPGKLTSEEFEIIKSHAINGYNILSDLNIDDIRDMAALHHEKLDGTGYPFGLTGDKLSTEVRIVAVADILSALLGVRSYKNEFSKPKIIGILKDMAENNKIDYEMVGIVIENYDYIVRQANEKCSEVMEIYENIMKEYKILLDKVS
ncbi:HD domain-containing phosphohydrolase [Clostridium paraputrificum]|uniref:HD domain-containing phosphohydrolase n=1 Tax=Clostridium TaxID=1485 RepID=UPI003D335930